VKKKRNEIKIKEKTTVISLEEVFYLLRTYNPTFGPTLSKDTSFPDLVF
jgi:hypothetical protein